MVLSLASIYIFNPLGDMLTCLSLPHSLTLRISKRGFSPTLNIDHKKVDCLSNVSKWLHNNIKIKYFFYFIDIKRSNCLLKLYSRLNFLSWSSFFYSYSFFDMSSSKSSNNRKLIRTPTYNSTRCGSFINYIFINIKWKNS